MAIRQSFHGNANLGVQPVQLGLNTQIGLNSNLGVGYTGQVGLGLGVNQLVGYNGQSPRKSVNLNVLQTPSVVPVQYVQSDPRVLVRNSLYTDPQLLGYNTRKSTDFKSSEAVEDILREARLRREGQETTKPSVDTKSDSHYYSFADKLLASAALEKPTVEITSDQPDRQRKERSKQSGRKNNQEEAVEEAPRVNQQEIDNLRRDVDYYRNKYTDLERLYNEKSNQDGEVYALRQRLSEQELRISKVSDDCENWRRRCEEYERELSSINGNLGEKSRQIIELEVRSLTERYMADKNDLERENNQLREVVRVKEMDVDGLRRELSQQSMMLMDYNNLQNENAKLRDLLNHNETHLSNLKTHTTEGTYEQQSVIVQLKNDHEKQRLVLRDRDEEIGYLKIKLDQVTKENNALIIDNGQLREQLAQKQKSSGWCC